MFYNLNWVDLIAIIIMIACIIEGLIKGFVLSIFKMTGIILSILAAKTFSYDFNMFICEKTGIDEWLLKYFDNKIQGFEQPAKWVINIMGGNSNKASNFLSSIIIIMLSFTLIFLMTIAILTIVANILDAAAKLPVLKQFNRVGGCIIGTLKGIVILYILFAVLIPVMPILSPKGEMASGFESSLFAAGFYKYNIIIPWFKEMIQFNI